MAGLRDVEGGQGKRVRRESRNPGGIRGEVGGGMKPVVGLVGKEIPMDGQTKDEDR